MTPSKAKEPEKLPEKEEIQETPVAEIEPVLGDLTNNNNFDNVDEDELIIKDELDNDCFEEVDRIGVIEKEVFSPLWSAHAVFQNFKNHFRMMKRSQKQNRQLKTNTKCLSSKQNLFSSRAMLTMKTH